MIVCEEYVGLMPVDLINADTIIVCLKDVLLHMDLEFKMQYSTLTGTKIGVAAQIKKLNEKCLLTHCYCHSFTQMEEIACEESSTHPSHT